MSEAHDLTVAEALERILATVAPLAAERLALADALGHVLAEPVVARDSLPPFANSSMDGYAVRAADIAGATPGAPVTLRVLGDIAAGSWPTLHVTAGTAARIMTGAPIPAGADAVVPVEETSEGWKSHARALPALIDIFRALPVGACIRPTGDDVRAGDVILQPGAVVRPQEISVLASLGVAQVAVVRRPRVGIVATGDELVPVEAALTPGKIRNSNGYAQAAQVRMAGGVPIDLGVARDTADDVRARLQVGLDAGVDLFISSAGVSVGAFDVVRAVLEAGGAVGFWRVRMRPGKPLAFGHYRDVPYIGLPGNPVSSMVSFERFARPAIRRLAGFGGAALHRPLVQAQMRDALTSDGRESYIRVVVSSEDGQTVARLAGGQGSHQISALVAANGLAIVPLGVQQVNAGDRLTVLLLD